MTKGLDSGELRIGVAGLGTVGVGVLRLLTDKQVEISARTGGALRVTAVSARDATRDRGVDLSALAFEADAAALAVRDDVDVLVEVIGGTSGAGAEAVMAALRAGKAVVTANKALVAERGAELAALVAEHGGALQVGAGHDQPPAVEGLPHDRRPGVVVQLLRDRLRHRPCQGCVGGDQDRGRQGIVLGLGHQIGGHLFRHGGVVGDDQHLAGARQGIDAHLAVDGFLGQGHVEIARSADHIHPGDRFGAPGQGGVGLVGGTGLEPVTYGL